MGCVRGAGMGSCNKIRVHEERREERREERESWEQENSHGTGTALLSRPSSASPTRTHGCGFFHAREFFSFSKGLLMTLNCVILLKSSTFQMYVRSHGFKWFLTLANTTGHLSTYLVEKGKYHLLETMTKFQLYFYLKPSIYPDKSQ